MAVGLKEIPPCVQAKRGFGNAVGSARHARTQTAPSYRADGPVKQFVTHAQTPLSRNHPGCTGPRIGTRPAVETPPQGWIQVDPRAWRPSRPGATPI